MIIQIILNIIVSKGTDAGIFHPTEKNVIFLRKVINLQQLLTNTNILEMFEGDLKNNIQQILKITLCVSNNRPRYHHANYGYAYDIINSENEGQYTFDQDNQTIHLSKGIEVSMYVLIMQILAKHKFQANQVDENAKLQKRLKAIEYANVQYTSGKMSFKDAIGIGMDPNGVDNNGHSLIAFAAGKGFKEFKEFLEYGADPYVAAKFVKDIPNLTNEQFLELVEVMEDSGFVVTEEPITVEKLAILTDAKVSDHKNDVMIVDAYIASRIIEMLWNNYFSSNNKLSSRHYQYYKRLYDRVKFLRNHYNAKSITENEIIHDDINQQIIDIAVKHGAKAENFLNLNCQDKQFELPEELLENCALDQAKTLCKKFKISVTKIPDKLKKEIAEGDPRLFYSNIKVIFGDKKVPVEFLVDILTSVNLTEQHLHVTSVNQIGGPEERKKVQSILKAIAELNLGDFTEQMKKMIDMKFKEVSAFNLFDNEGLSNVVARNVLLKNKKSNEVIYRHLGLQSAVEKYLKEERRLEKEQKRKQEEDRQRQEAENKRKTEELKQQEARAKLSERIDFVLKVLSIVIAAIVSYFCGHTIARSSINMLTAYIAESLYSAGHSVIEKGFRAEAVKTLPAEFVSSLSCYTWRSRSRSKVDAPNPNLGNR